MKVYMEEQSLPIHRGTVGFYDIRELTLGSWKRMGARGAFIELNGCGGLVDEFRNWKRRGLSSSYIRTVRATGRAAHGRYLVAYSDGSLCR